MNEHQDELMAAQSVDGRSPTHRQRSVGWQLLALGFGLVVGLIIIIAMLYGIPGATAVRYAVVLLALLSIGGMPIWVLVNWRGTEERDARRQAVDEQGGRHTPNQAADAAAARRISTEGNT
ncbi:MAG: hypothetical protein K2Y21_08910 [Phycisphaerales bacterium]|nr:hypothetical protein [Phycisphaerales bacterium]